MCNVSGTIFSIKNLNPKEVEDKRIIEIGSYNINGGIRSVIESWQPKEYIGVDISMGPGVDVVCKVEDLVSNFSESSFDIVIANELLEHVEDWRAAIHNMKSVCKIGGTIIITTRSKGFHYHGYPHDFWRYELEDMKNIFSDFHITSLESDSQEPGIFIKAVKPDNYQENDVDSYELYSIILNKKVKIINETDKKSFYFLKNYLKEKIKKILFKWGKYLFMKV